MRMNHNVILLSFEHAPRNRPWTGVPIAIPHWTLADQRALCVQQILNYSRICQRHVGSHRFVATCGAVEELVFTCSGKQSIVIFTVPLPFKSAIEGLSSPYRLTGPWLSNLQRPKI